MARLESQKNRWLVVAETPAEHGLIDHGQRNGGYLVLLDAFYALHQNGVLLPDTISYPGALRVCRALTAAAEAHQRAMQRRHSFHLVSE